MGKAQTDFLIVFKSAFKERFTNEPDWRDGQIRGNVAQLPGRRELRREGILKRSEQFELGDSRGNFLDRTIVIEYDQMALSLSNLVKYWPYIRGELSIKPEHPLVLCHFSNWWSYGAYRDLWDWTMHRIQTDEERLVGLNGRQFDHGGTNVELRNRSIQEALDGIAMISAPEVRNAL